MNRLSTVFPFSIANKWNIYRILMKRERYMRKRHTVKYATPCPAPKRCPGVEHPATIRSKFYIHINECFFVIESPFPFMPIYRFGPRQMAEWNFRALRFGNSCSTVSSVTFRILYSIVDILLDFFYCWRIDATNKFGVSKYFFFVATGIACQTKVSDKAHTGQTEMKRAKQNNSEIRTEV